MIGIGHAAPTIAGHGTEEQRRRYLRPMFSGEEFWCQLFSEPDSGSDLASLATRAVRDGDEYVINGSKIWSSGAHHARFGILIARTDPDVPKHKGTSYFILPMDLPGVSLTPIVDMTTAHSFNQTFFDDVRLPAEALVGEPDAALAQLFAGLNPERILGAAMAVGMGRYALDAATAFAKERAVWKTPIGAHQGISHPLAQVKIELELAKLMMQKAAVLYDSGDDSGAAEAANMAKYAAAEASIKALDQAIQTHGGAGLTKEYGLAAMLGAARIARVAPVSREMILNFVAQHSLGLPRSY